MKSDTTLQVFDGDGMYGAERLVSAVEFGMPPRDEVIREAISATLDSVFPKTMHVPDSDDAEACPPTLSDIEKMLDAHPAGLSKAFAQWLVRICRASDARIVQLEDEVKLKQSDFNGLVSEWQDLADENRRLKQQAEVDRVVCDSQERTILELQARIKQLESAVGMQLNELLELDQSSAS